METLDHAPELFIRHHTRYEVSPYFVVLDVRTFGVHPSNRRIQAGFDVDLYGSGPDLGSTIAFENGELQTALDQLSAACRAVVAQATENTTVEIIPFAESIVIDVKGHFEPEALVCIRITHSRGIDQPVGASEEKVLADVEDSLRSLGVMRS
jgi:hypothetical protein